jgi:phosphate acetyltransferase
MNLMEELINRIKSDSMQIVFPEGEEKNIIAAAVEIKKSRIATPILLGSKDSITKIAVQTSIDINGLSIVEPATSPNLEHYIDRYSLQKIFPRNASRRIISTNLGFGAMMVKAGDADGMIAGIAHATEQVIMMSQLIIGMQEGISIPSSFMILDIPGFVGEDGSFLVIADPAINPDPTSEQLADIAISTADSVKEILSWEPRVAMLSFSTLGSATHQMVDKVLKAVEIAHQRRPSLLLDGEFQLDAAIVPEVAQRKVKRESQVAGRANIIIVPDLNSGNIGCKLIQRLARAKAYGAVLQGFALPVSDLSRGATIEDIVGVAILLAVRGQVS